jgi:pimeloyl-ACP methyl ester carboxylesterase
MRIDVAGRSAYAYTGTRPIDLARRSVILVHGAGNDHSVWALQSRYLAHHGYNAVAIDLPGHGRSEGAPLESVEAIAVWLARLLDAFAIDRAAIVGHSLGSLATLELAARASDRVTRIALLGPAVPMAVSDLLLDAARANDHAACEMIVGWSHSHARQLGGNPVPGLWMSGNALRLLERAAPDVLYTDLNACLRYQAGLNAASRISCPALAILGERDLMAPPKAAAALLEALTHPRVLTLPGCGHAMMAEAPDAVLDALREFLGAR